MGLSRLLFQFLSLTVFLFLASFLAALLGVFYLPLILGIFLGLVLLFKLIFPATSRPPARSPASLNVWELLALIWTSLFCLYIFLNFSPSLTGGRDAGALVEAAASLAKHHQLSFSPSTLKIFDNQGANQLALNYPGFLLTNDHQLRTQFNLGYPAFLGFCWSLFGPTGLKLANLFGLTLGLLSFFLIIKRISRNHILALAGLPLLSISFPFFWHARQNFSESLAFGFLFAAIWLLLKITQTSRPHPQSIPLLILTLFCFTLIRIEGILVALLALLLLLFFHSQKNKILFPPRVIALITFLAGLFFAYSLTILPFYQKIVKDLIGWGEAPSAAPAESFINRLLSWYYLLRVFFHYQLLPLFVLGFLKIILLIPSLLKRLTQKRVLPALVPLVLAGPFLVYFITPLISFDHPWILRRFMFACLPLLLLYALLFIYQITSQKLLTFALLAFLLIFPLRLFFDYGFFIKNPALATDLEVLSRRFQKTDLILVDKSIAPNDWSLVSEPLRFLFDQNAVYIYNPADINKIKPEDFHRVFLLADQEASARYRSFIDPAGASSSFTLHFQELNIRPFTKPRDYVAPFHLPARGQQSIRFQIYPLHENSDSQTP